MIQIVMVESYYISNFMPGEIQKLQDEFHSFIYSLQFYICCINAVYFVQCVEESAMSSSEEHEELKTKDESELANRMSEELDVDDLAADQFISSSSSSSSHAASTFPLSNDFRIPVNYVDAEAQQTSSSGKNKAFVLSSDASLHSTEDARGKQYSAFGAADVEKELDMLLDSLSQTNILDSSGFKSNNSIPVSLGVW